MSNDIKCERYGCGKRLRRDNAKGVCSTGCLSSLAPPSARAKSTASRDVSPAVDTPPRDERTHLQKFRLVCDALGKDADLELEYLAAQWLRTLAEKVAP